MHLAFYRGPGNFIDRTIRAVTRGPYSHVEMLFSDGICFSASGRYPNYGVRWVHKQLSSHWDLVELKVTPEQEQAAKTFADTMVGLCFAWRSLLQFILPWISSNLNCWYCSEIVLMLMQRSFGLYLKSPRKIHPNALYRLVTGV